MSASPGGAPSTSSEPAEACGGARRAGSAARLHRAAPAGARGGRAVAARGLLGAGPDACVADARRASSGRGARRLTAPARGPPVQPADPPQVHEAGEQEEHEDEQLDVPEPAEAPRRDRPGEDEHGLQVEDHEEQRDLVELDGEAPRQGARRLDAGLVLLRLGAVVAPPAEQPREREDQRRDHEDEGAVQRRRPHLDAKMAYAHAHPPSQPVGSVNVLYAARFPW